MKLDQPPAPRKKRSIPGWILKVVILVVIIAALGIFQYSRHIADSAVLDTANFEVVSAPSTGPREIQYGPSRLLLDTGAQVVLPRGGRFTDREVTLQRGRVTAVVRKLTVGEEFAVRTPQAVAGVRGTVFSVGIISGTKTSVEVQEGSVAVVSISGPEVMLNAGQAVNVEAAKPPVVFSIGSLPPNQGEPYDLPALPKAYEEPPRAPVAADHTSRSRTNEPAADQEMTAEERARRGGPSAGQYNRGTFGVNNPNSDNPQANNPQPSNPQPRSLR